jgi:hypothetical protein
VVRRALARATDVLDVAHRRWWHEFYAHSFVSVPDRSVQRFYWVQIYKLGALGRAGGPATAGWRAWPAELGDGWTAAWRRLAARTTGPLLDTAMAGMDAPGADLLEVALPGMGSKAGRLASPLASLHNLWHCQRHSMNGRLEQEVLRPLLHRALERYRPFLVLGGDGRWHLPSSCSPGAPDATDSTYHLALLRWGATTLATTAGRSAPAGRPWADLLTRLAPYRRDASGVLIGARTQLRRSRPHPSHLMWIHPLRERGWDEPVGSRLRRVSFDTWAARRDGWQAHSYASAASMAAVMGDSTAALRHLRTVLCGQPLADAAVRANTLYHQHAVPGLESPFAIAEATLDLLLDGAGGVVNIFPAVGPTWQEASFAGLRVPGGFVVDAERAASRTQWVRVRGHAGGSLTLRHGITGEVGVHDERGRAIPSHATNGAVSFTLPAGRTAIVCSAAGRVPPPPDAQPRQVAEDGTGRVWGLPA